MPNNFIEFTEFIPETGIRRKRSFNVTFITGVIDRNDGKTCSIGDNGYYVTVDEPYGKVLKKVEKAWRDE